MTKLIPIILFLGGCASTSLEEAQQAQIRYLREECMKSVGPQPLLRVSAIHQCNAWARAKVL